MINTSLWTINRTCWNDTYKAAWVSKVTSPKGGQSSGKIPSFSKLHFVLPEFVHNLLWTHYHYALFFLKLVWTHCQYMSSREGKYGQLLLQSKTNYEDVYAALQMTTNYLKSMPVYSWNWSDKSMPCCTVDSAVKLILCCIKWKTDARCRQVDF